MCKCVCVSVREETFECRMDVKIGQQVSSTGRVEEIR